MRTKSASPTLSPPDIVPPIASRLAPYVICVAAAVAMVIWDAGFTLRARLHLAFVTVGLGVVLTVVLRRILAGQAAHWQVVLTLLAGQFWTSIHAFAVFGWVAMFHVELPFFIDDQLPGAGEAITYIALTGPLLLVLLLVAIPASLPKRREPTQWWTMIAIGLPLLVLSPFTILIPSLMLSLLVNGD